MVRSVEGPRGSDARQTWIAASSGCGNGRDCRARDPHTPTLHNTSGNLPDASLDRRDLIPAPREAGWQHVATKGSHHQFKPPSRPGRVTVPPPKCDIPVGTLRRVEQQAGWKRSAGIMTAYLARLRK
ncbi:MAG TPA: type II toxin-antitoxin system HicA family toxin [Acetobacteraceae bacterium]|nr:type II toxin-antitoxin system HicA family toxin [Acetobacteraceae bacterium]